MEWLGWVLSGFGITEFLAILASYFLVVKNNTTITTLKESNAAYKERNEQLEKDNTQLKGQIERLIKDYQKQLSELKGKVEVLEKIKTPPIEPLIKMIGENHKEVMTALQKKEK